MVRKVTATDKSSYQSSVVSTQLRPYGKRAEANFKNHGRTVREASE